MFRLAILAVLLLLGASYLLFGSWWSGPDAGPVPTVDDAGISDRRPDLAVTTARPRGDEAEARRILAKLKSMNAIEAAAWMNRFRAGDPAASMPFHPDLAEFLAGLLGAGPQLSTNAMHFLHLMGPQALPFVAPLLTGEVTRARRTAAFAVIERWHRDGHTFEMPSLVPLIEAQNKYGRWAIIKMISRGVPYDEKLAEYLLDLLRQTREGGSTGPGAGLARMGPQGANLLVDLLGSDLLRERLAALHGLRCARARDLRPHLPMLSRLIADESENGSVRATAIYALRAMEGDCAECLPALRIALSLDSHVLLKPTLVVLEQMGPRAAAAVPDLIPWLAETDWRQGEEVARVLGTIASHPELVLPALAAVIERRGSDAAAMSMAAYGLQAYREAERILDEGDEHAQYSILWYFARLGERSAGIVPKLIPLINGEDDDIGRRVVGTLGYIGPKAASAIPEIMRRLAEGERALPPLSAGKALSRMGPAAERALVAALGSASETEARQAVRALLEFPCRTAFALDGLEVLLKSEDAKLRSNAVEAIGIAIFDPLKPEAIHPPAKDASIVERVRALLKRAEKDEDPFVQERARKFLLWLDIREGRPFKAPK